MKHLRAKLFFAAALALTLGLKLLLYHQEQLLSHQEPPAPLGDAVASFLLHHGFEARVEKRLGQVALEAAISRVETELRLPFFSDVARDARKLSVNLLAPIRTSTNHPGTAIAVGQAQPLSLLPFFGATENKLESLPLHSC